MNSFVDRNYRPTVSVIVPVYNSERTLQKCVESLLSLSYPKEKLELIFVNNASTDSTQGILNGYNGRIRVLFEKKAGPAAARNNGLRNASGEVVVFTDADCTVEKDWLKKLVRPLQDESVGIVGGKILAKRPCNKIEKFGERIHNHEKAITASGAPYVITMNWASRFTLLKKVGLFDENLRRCEDSDLSYRIFQTGTRFVYEPDAVVFHKNERSFTGLFGEGYLHGFGSAKMQKKHKKILGKNESKRFYLRSYTQIISSLFDYFNGVNRDASICYVVFNSGKKLGKLFGSLRYRYLTL